MGIVASLIARQLRALREQQRLSVSQLSRMTVSDGYAGVGEGTIKAIERNPGRVPEAEIIEALADALSVKPADFYEYPIAVARREARARAAEKRLASELAEEAQRTDERRSGARRANDASDGPGGAG